MVSGNQQHRLVRLALSASVRTDEILSANSHAFRLSAEDSASFRNSCFDLAACITALGKYYHERGTWLYHFTIKTHYLLHSGDESSQANPRMAWCYQGESMMNKVKVLVQSSCRGSTSALTMNKAMFKYMVGMPFSLMTADRWWK